MIRTLLRTQKPRLVSGSNIGGSLVEVSCTTVFAEPELGPDGAPILKALRIKQSNCNMDVSMFTIVVIDKSAHLNRGTRRTLRRPHRGATSAFMGFESAAMSEEVLDF